MRWHVGAGVLLAALTPLGWAADPPREEPRSLPAIPYEEAARPDGLTVLRMRAPLGKGPGAAVAVNRATGRRLWQVPDVYSPTLAGEKGKDSWAVRFYRGGEKVKEYTLQDLAAAAKAAPADLLPKEPVPLGWLARFEAPKGEADPFLLTLADGSVLPLDGKTAQLREVRKVKLEPGDVRRETLLARGYRQALAARRTAPGLNAFAVRLHDRVAEADGNSLLSPHGVVSCLGALAGVADEDSAKKIAEVVFRAGKGPQESLPELYRRVAQAAAGEQPAPLGVEVAPDPKEGVVVRKVQPGSPLEGHAQAGDRILKVQEHALAGSDDLRVAVDTLFGDLTLTVLKPAGEVHEFRVPTDAAAPVFVMRTTAWCVKDRAADLAARFGELPDVRLGRLEAAAEKAAAEINRHLGDFTRQNKSALVTPRDVPDEGGVLLTNALYFAAGWARPFDEKDTDPRGEFRVAKEKVVRVPLMKATARLPYWESAAGKYAAVELPYRDGRYGMVLVVPRSEDGLREVEHALAGQGTEELFDRLDGGSQEVALQLPRFQFGHFSSLRAPLTALGLPPVLTLKPARSPGSQKPLVLKDVRQDALIQVNEQGTQASAATTVVLGTIGISKQVVLKATHPFLFLIRDRSTNTILFIGRVTNPSAT
jgi:serine protease inhibitor